jgi:hypothetical protein
MTDRYSAITVILERNIREDDAEPLIAAIKLLRGVLDAQPIIAEPISDSIAYARVRYELGRDLLGVLYPEKKKES